jgi:hypothetical protein
MRLSVAEWNQYPQTIEELLVSIGAQTMWEAKHDKPADLFDSIVITKELFADVATRLLILEHKLEVF